MADQAPIDFYFEFSSPYGYFASLKVDDLAAKLGRETVWRPFLLGVVFQTTGQSPLTAQPLRGDYSRRDFDRSARQQKVPFIMPEEFPVLSIAAARAFRKISVGQAERNSPFARESPASAPPQNGAGRGAGEARPRMMQCRLPPIGR